MFDRGSYSDSYYLGQKAKALCTWSSTLAFEFLGDGRVSYFIDPQNKNISFDLFISSLNEKKEIRKKSFYMNNFFKSFNYSENEAKNLNIVITPGLIAFLYYSGSIVFVCISLLLVILSCSFIEKLFSYISGKNIILANLIGYALAVRFIHFGYVPYNTINYLLSFFITLLVIYFLTKLISKSNHKI